MGPALCDMPDAVASGMPAFTGLIRLGPPAFPFCPLSRCFLRIVFRRAGGSFSFIRSRMPWQLLFLSVLPVYSAIAFHSTSPHSPAAPSLPPVPGCPDSCFSCQFPWYSSCRFPSFPLGTRSAALSPPSGQSRSFFRSPLGLTGFFHGSILKETENTEWLQEAVAHETLYSGSGRRDYQHPGHSL